MTLALALVAGSFAITNGQPQLGNGRDLSPPPTNLAVEVYYYPKEPPAYMTVAPSQARPIGAWYARFARVSGWTASADFPTINAVDIRPVLIGERVQITVSALFGKFNDQQKPVGIYTLREGEKVRVRELANFGVEPFELALVRMAPANPELPQFVSKAPAIELVTIQPNLSTLPSHRLVLRNVSAKNVRAIMVRTVQNQRVKTSGLRDGKEGNPLIMAGGSAEITQRAITRATVTPGGYKPDTPDNQTIEISTAIFDDGSYQGEAQWAVGYLAVLKGQKAQLSRVVAVFQEAAESSQGDPAKILESLQRGIAQLKTEADPVAVQELMNDHPGVSKPADVKDTIEVEMLYLRKDVLSDIGRFQAGHPALDSNSLQAWLAASKQRYEAWLSRL